MQIGMTLAVSPVDLVHMHIYRLLRMLDRITAVVTRAGTSRNMLSQSHARNPQPVYEHQLSDYVVTIFQRMKSANSEVGW